MLAERSIALKAAPKRKVLTLRGPDGGRPKLLLAEDSDPVRIVTAAMLKGMGCDVDAVVHGEDAVKSASTHPFDVIVLDIEMPVMDGITAARNIRKLGGTLTQTPIMALSAFLADAMQSAVWSDTFDIALPKPANRNELHAAVEAALGCHPRSAGYDDFSSEPLISKAQWDAAHAGLSSVVWAELLRVACRDIEQCLVRAFGRGKGEGPAVIAVYAQKLKALGRTFAAPRLAAVAARLEIAVTESETNLLLGRLEIIAAATCAALRS